jgi:hypothetical protein
VLIGLESFRVYKFTSFLLLNEQVNNNKQRKEKVAKRKENQHHKHSLFINIVNNRYKYKGVYNLSRLIGKPLLAEGLRVFAHLVTLCYLDNNAL